MCQPYGWDEKYSVVHLKTLKHHIVQRAAGAMCQETLKAKAAIKIFFFFEIHDSEIMTEHAGGVWMEGFYLGLTD